MWLLTMTASSAALLPPLVLETLACHQSRVRMAVDKLLICFLHWLTSKMGSPLAHYKDEIRKIILLDIQSLREQENKSAINRYMLEVFL